MATEWGVPTYDDRRLFEMLTLEVFQAGLSWAVILCKREALRCAFAGFDPARIARWGAGAVRRLLANAAIIRNRRKIEAVIANARAFCRVQKEHQSFARYVWNFIGGRPIKPARPYRSWAEVPAQTQLSRQLSADLRRRGFRFMGPTATYAFMQAVGLVDDRLTECQLARDNCPQLI